MWKRDIIITILSITSVFATSLGPILAADTLTLSLHYELAFTEIALLTGYFLLGVGVAVAVALEDDDVVEVELALLEAVLSDGQACPGSSMKVEFLANCFCTARVSFAVGLMTPTMP